MRADDHRPDTEADTRARRAKAARQARGLLAGTAGTRLLSEELLAERRAEARAERAQSTSRPA